MIYVQIFVLVYHKKKVRSFKEYSKQFNKKYKILNNNLQSLIR
jgi:hypothetical protein